MAEKTDALTPETLISVTLQLGEASMLSELVSGHVDTFYDRPGHYTADDAARFKRWVMVRDILRVEIRKGTVMADALICEHKNPLEGRMGVWLKPRCGCRVRNGAVQSLSSRLLEALYKLALVQHHRMTHGGGTRLVGYSCKLCGGATDTLLPNQIAHHEECLLRGYLQ